MTNGAVLDQGITDASAIPAGFKGESGSTDFVDKSTATAGTFVTGIASMTLLAGKYMINCQGSINISNGSASTVSTAAMVALRVSTTQIDKVLASTNNIAASNNVYFPFTLVTIVNISGSTTYSLDIVSNQSSGTGGSVASVYAYDTVISGSAKVGGRCYWNRL